MVALALLLTAGAAEANPTPPAATQTPVSLPASGSTAEPMSPTGLRWDDAWPRFRPLEYVVTGVVGPAAIAEYIWLPGPGEARFVGGILFDNAVRNALRLRSTSALRFAWTGADVVGISVTTLVVGVDSLIVPLARGSSDVAFQTTLMSLESYSLSSIVAITLYSEVGRARPSYSDCKVNPNFNPDCDLAANDSFPSGHTNEAFTAAGLSCANHGHLPIYGSKLADTLACVRDLTLASAEGVLRVMGDRHYATDVIAGGIIGFGFGFGVPTMLHYGHAPFAGMFVSPMLGASHVGVVASGAL